MKVTGLAAASCSSFLPALCVERAEDPGLNVARQLVSGSLGPPLSRSRRTRPFGCRHSADSSYRSLICWRRLRCAAGPTRRTGAAADQFAANVLPIVRAIQLRASLAWPVSPRRSMPAAFAPRAVAPGMHRQCVTCSHGHQLDARCDLFLLRCFSSVTGSWAGVSKFFTVGFPDSPDCGGRRPLLANSSKPGPRLVYNPAKGTLI
jgi:hypothetical protein